jgi:hypothetical protein
MKFLIPTTCVVLLSLPAFAGAPTAQNAPAVDTTSTAAPALLAKTHSDFAVHTDAHNPFWPIGWVKTEAISSLTTDSASAYVPKIEDFNVSTIMLSEPRMAVINGKDMAEGEIASLPAAGQTVVVQLVAVQDGRVILRWQNQPLTIAIHRDETLNSTDIAAMK